MQHDHLQKKSRCIIVCNVCGKPKDNVIIGVLKGGKELADKYRFGFCKGCIDNMKTICDQKYNVITVEHEESEEGAWATATDES